MTKESVVETFKKNAFQDFSSKFLEKKNISENILEKWQKTLSHLADFGHCGWHSMQPDIVHYE